MSPHSFLPYRSLLELPSPVDPFALRVTRAGGEENPAGAFVLYWAQSARRLYRNLGLDYAITKANALGLPVVVYESIRPDYPSANDRLHVFVLEGVARNRRDATERGLRYVFFLPRTPMEARGAVARLAAAARLVVTDDFPTFVVREHNERFAARSTTAFHLVDSNGLVPMRAFSKEQYSAKILRDRAHRILSDFWARFEEPEPHAQPYIGPLEADDWRSGDPREAAAACEIDHPGRPVATRGGREAALARLDAFVRDLLAGYAERHNREPGRVSGLSPYLHFGHIGIHEVAERVLSSDAPLEDLDAFLEQAVIRRELSFNLCFYRRDHASITALPEWAWRTLDAHRGDRRKPCYQASELEAAGTHDEVWNLAQRALLVTGTMHGYLRMLWGKKILEWMQSPEEAHAIMLLLHQKYALDGRDPNTHAGILWCLGKHDRPWAPERPIFGTIRYMSSDSTRKKVRLDDYERFVEEEARLANSERPS